MTRLLIACEERGLHIEEAIVEPDGELCVYIPVQNPSYDPLCLKSGDVLGWVHPEEIKSPLEYVSTIFDGDGAVNSREGDKSDSQEADLLNAIHVEESLEKLKALVHEFANVFALDPSELGTTDLVTHVIDMGDNSPIKQPPRSIPFALHGKVDQLVQEMLDEGIVTPSKSPWSSPVVLIAKKDGTTRFCVDYRQLKTVC